MVCLPARNSGRFQDAAIAQRLAFSIRWARDPRLGEKFSKSAH
jgi:hypothetical protein